MLLQWHFLTRMTVEQLKDQIHRTLSVRLSSASNMYLTAIGAHPNQCLCPWCLSDGFALMFDMTVPQGELSPFLLNDFRILGRAWQSLGLTPVYYTPGTDYPAVCSYYLSSSDLLTFAYYAQCRCDPAVNYFTHLSVIVRRLDSYGSCPASLMEVLATERSRDRVTSEDLARAGIVLGFVTGADGPLKLNEIPQNIIEGAWEEYWKRFLGNPEHSLDMLGEAIDSLFYGKIRQRITGPQLSRSSIHEKEGLFSHLPVNITNDDDILHEKARQGEVSGSQKAKEVSRNRKVPKRPQEDTRREKEELEQEGKMKLKEVEAKEMAMRMEEIRTKEEDAQRKLIDAERKALDIKRKEEKNLLREKELQTWEQDLQRREQEVNRKAAEIVLLARQKAIFRLLRSMFQDEIRYKRLLCCSKPQAQTLLDFIQKVGLKVR